MLFFKELSCRSSKLVFNPTSALAVQVCRVNIHKFTAVFSANNAAFLLTLLYLRNSPTKIFWQPWTKQNFFYIFFFVQTYVNWNCIRVFSVLQTLSLWENVVLGFVAPKISHSIILISISVSNVDIDWCDTFNVNKILLDLARSLHRDKRWLEIIRGSFIVICNTI